MPREVGNNEHNDPQSLFFKKHFPMAKSKKKMGGQIQIREKQESKTN